MPGRPNRFQENYDFCMLHVFIIAFSLRGAPWPHLTIMIFNLDSSELHEYLVPAGAKVNPDFK